jgi:uncharacterized protein YfaS (alpha-2-macroglobulin family)
MTRRRPLAALLAVAGLLAWAPRARADEVYATVERTAAPGERALVKVRSDAGGPATLVVFRVESPTTFLDAGLDPSHGETLYPPLKARLDEALRAGGPNAPAPFRLPGEARPTAPAGDPGALTYVALVKATLPAAAQGKSEAVVEVPLPASGLYLVEVRRAEAATLVAALSSRLALVQKRDPSRVLVWAVDRRTGLPIQDVGVEARAAGKVLATAKTDGSGLASLAVSGSPSLEVRGAVADDVAFGAEPYHPASADDLRVHAFTHQPAYRPGERVEAKGVVRAVREGRCVLAAEAREAVVRFVAAGEKELGRATAAVSRDLGTFAAGLDLPKDAPTGDATLVVEILGKSYAAPFRIEEYRRPSFEVSVEAKPARVASGAPVAFDVAATHFEGGPVVGGHVVWDLAFHRVDRDLFPTDEMARLFFGTEREAFAAVPAGHGEGSLDEKGRLHLDSKGFETKEDGYLSLVATVIGPDRTAVSSTGTAAVTARPLTVALKTDRHVYGAEGVARVTVKAVLADGSPASAREGVLTAARVTEGATGAPEERVTASRTFTTDEKGSASLDVPFSENGRYALAVAMPRAASEPAGPPASAVLHAWVVGDRADVGYTGDRLEVVADKDSYAVGETARILVLSPAGARPFLWTSEGARISGEKVYAFERKKTTGAGSNAVVDVPVGAADAPNAYVGVCVVDQGNLLSASTMLRVPPVDRLLVPRIETDKPEYEPGRTARVEVSVSDASGKPAAGVEVAVAIVDDSLYALYSDPSAPLETFFHPLRRNDVATGGPIHLLSTGWGVFSPPSPAKPAALGLTGGSAGAPPPAGAVPAPNAPPVPSPRPAAAAEPAPRADPARGSDERLRFRLGETAGEGSREEHARFGDGGADGAEKKDAKEGGEGPLAARADFRAAIWWSPTLRTGPDGRTEALGVPLAESLTRWRVTASAVDASTRVGTSVSTFRTAKKVLTRVTLPRFLRATDRVEAPWVLHSLLGEPAEASFVARVGGLDVKGPYQGTETLAAGALVTHDLSLSAPRIGRAVVRGEIRTTAGGDASETSIEVLPQGIPKTLVASAWSDGGRATLPPLSLPRTAEPGTARLKVVVAPSYAQAAVAALPYLADYPYGCTEQTMSRLVPVVVAKVARDVFKAPLSGRLAELDSMLDAGLSRLERLQHQDGGFGWWEADASDAYMTAYVAHGLTRAIPVAKDPARAKAVLDRACAWLEKAVPRGADSPIGAAGEMAVMALAEAGRLDAKRVGTLPGDGILSTPSLVRAFHLRALVAAKGAPADVASHARDLAARAARDAQGVRWQDSFDAPGRRWEDDAVETTAWCLGALLAADAKHPDLVPGARWLLSQRANGDRWRSTRDTAACVAFLSRLAAVTGDAGAGRDVLVELNGRALGTVGVTPQDAWSATATLEVPASELPAAPLVVTAVPGSGSVSVSAALSFTETGPAIDAANSGFRVERSWHRIDRSGPIPHRLAWTETVPTGTVVEAWVIVVAENPGELVMVTSPHPAGFEPERVLVDVEGKSPAWAKADHVETRDDRTVFFVKAMEAGKPYVFRHTLRATHVGSFTALPAQAELMYFPEFRGNSKGEVLEISKSTPAGREGGR